MNIRSDIKSLVSGSDDPESTDGFKTISLRLSYEEFAKLKVLSSKIGMRPTPLAMKILSSGLSEAVGGYFDASDNDQIIVSDFAEAVRELTIDLISEEK